MVVKENMSTEPIRRQLLIFLAVQSLELPPYQHSAILFQFSNFLWNKPHF